MTFDYAEVADTAKELLAEYGRGPDDIKRVTLRNIVPGAYDPATGTTSAPATTDNLYDGVLLDFAAGQTMVRGTLIQANDKQLLLSPEASATLSPEDHVLVGTDEYTIVSIGTIAPAGIVVLFDLHLHK